MQIIHLHMIRRIIRKQDLLIQIVALQLFKPTSLCNTYSNHLIHSGAEKKFEHFLETYLIQLKDCESQPTNDFSEK